MSGEAFWGSDSYRFFWQKGSTENNYEWAGMAMKAGATVAGIPALGTDSFAADTRNSSPGTYWRFTRHGMSLGFSGEWHHIAQVYDDTTPELRLYVDGVNVGTKYGPSGTRRGEQTTPLRIGGRVESTSLNWRGRVGPAAFFDYALSGARIAAHAAAGTASAHAAAVNADSPEAFWRLDEASGTLADDTGNGHTGTAGGVGGWAIGYREGGPWSGSYALGFNGDAWVEVPHHTVFSSTSFTMCGWLRCEPDPSSSGLHIGSLRFGSTGPGW